MAASRSFDEYLTLRRGLLPLCTDIATSGALTVERSAADGSVFFRFRRDKLADHQHGKHVAQLFRELKGDELASGIDLFCLVGLIGFGPKVFRPTAEECFALEEVEVRVPIADYAQPFPTFAVVYPPEYVEARRMQGTGLAYGSWQEYAPIATVVRHDPEMGVVCSATITDSEDETVLAGIMGSTGAATIETDLGGTLWSDMHSNDDEQTQQRRCTRVALNACLLLMDKGFRKGPESFAERSAVASLKQARAKGGEALEHARASRRLVPTEYGFVQQVNVRRAVRGDVVESGDEQGGRRKVRPHWRSAHWRMQACGAGRSQRKRTLIPHVMVNRESFRGEESETTVIQS